MAKRQEPTNTTSMDMPLREVEPIAPLGGREPEPELELDLVQPDPSEEAAKAELEQAPEPVAVAMGPGPDLANAISTREMLKRMDVGWAWFRAAAGSFPNEHMDEHLDDGWTRKQMLAHVAAWHDVTHDRLGTLIATEKPDELIDDTDRFNARVARQAIGRTAGEVLKEMEGTFNRLRRRVAQLTNEQLAAHEGWAVAVIAGNTYDHYEEHRQHVRQTEPVDARQGRR